MITGLLYLFAANCFIGASFVYFTEKAKARVEAEMKERCDWQDRLDRAKDLDARTKLLYRKMYFIDKE